MYYLTLEWVLLILPMMTNMNTLKTLYVTGTCVLLEYRFSSTHTCTFSTRPNPAIILCGHRCPSYNHVNNALEALQHHVNTTYWLVYCVIPCGSTLRIIDGLVQDCSNSSALAMDKWINLQSVLKNRQLLHLGKWTLSNTSGPVMTNKNGKMAKIKDKQFFFF